MGKALKKPFKSPLKHPRVPQFPEEPERPLDLSHIVWVSWLHIEQLSDWVLRNGQSVTTWCIIMKEGITKSLGLMLLPETVTGITMKGDLQTIFRFSYLKVLYYVN